MAHIRRGRGRRVTRATRVPPAPAIGATPGTPDAALKAPWPAPPPVVWPPVTDRYVHALSTEAVPILHHGVQRATWDGRPFALPYVALDTTGRPDLMDLTRVHRLEGAGGRLDSRWVWDGDGDWVILERTCTVPARARVVLRFDQEPHGPFIERAARSGLFGVHIGQGMLVWETLAGAGELNAFLARRTHRAQSP